jgi:hypothetical protein
MLKKAIAQMQKTVINEGGRINKELGCMIRFLQKYIYLLTKNFFNNPLGYINFRITP